jgi:SAM-dependent methyltransferase
VAKQNDQTIKACCAALYAGDWVRLLLGESFHPGGLALTERLGELLGLGPGRRVLDVASGSGTSALLLARRFGCDVVGVDYSADAVAQASRRAEQAGLADRVRFIQGDAERLPLPRADFDAVVCECAFCIFPDKLAATTEFARVLRPDGRLGLADLTREGPLPEALDSLLAWIACLGDARPLAEYRTLLCACGFGEPLVERHDEALMALAGEVRGRLLDGGLLSVLGGLLLPEADLEHARQLAYAAAQAVQEGTLGYVLLVSTRA